MRYLRAHPAGPRVPVLAACLLVAFQASAQAQHPRQAPSGAAPDLQTLDEIVVRGEKSERSLQDTAASVAVSTSVKIEQENLLSLFDILNRTANVSQMYGDRGFTIRGIANEAGAPNPLATIYVDGAALPSQVSDVGPTDLWDIAQVEVLRGPQSTIQGENALAGAIVLRTEDPTMDWSGRARVLLSDPSDRRVAFAGGGPLVADELAFRVAVEDRSFDGFVDNPTRGVGEDERESTMARAKLLWTPGGIEGLTARLTYTRDDRQGPYMYAYSRNDVPDHYDHRINTSDYPGGSDALGRIATLEVDHVLSGRWSVSAVTAWSDTDMRRSFDTDLSERPEAYGDTDEQYGTVSQELRVHYAGDRLRGLAGLYGSQRDMDNASVNRTNVETPVATIAAVLQGAGLDAATAQQVAGLYAQAVPVIPVDYASDGRSRSRNLALFTDFEVDLGRRLALLGGLRYDREEYRFGAVASADFAGVLPEPAAFGEALAPAIAGINQAVLGMVQQANSLTPESTRDFTAFLPKLGLRYAWTDDVSTALVVQRGYRSGGSAFNIARGRNFAYDPEYTWNAELSLRSRWLDDALTLNANLYYIDWEDKQVTARFGINDYDYHTVNAGKAHLYGFELEAGHRVGPGFDWYASLGHSRTRYDEFETILGAEINDYTGSEFAYAPRWTFAVGANVHLGDHWVANLNANHRSDVTPDIGGDARRLPSRTLVNGRFGYEALDWSAYVFVSNLFDRGYTQYAWSDDSPNVILGAPRVVGVGFDYRW
ncbi:TonB-dependent receptor [Luteimonas sp. RD2P54]|uniref:TonB-dependent receptor n=1 Tax=Luteimonas endophytica TaxID=3042023 RepID=A0ABT6JDT4_9GAMM|nr:TonB-dependent receptor [Luteimonas endophytica]MDH5824984.1 TonB-dependent receptor [Luteimonas endophytica]